ncbi:MAG: hypothetical protein AAF629_15905 [Chloroflexota bacterium]
MHVFHEDYQIKYNTEAHTIACAGKLRLMPSDYVLIMSMLMAASNEQTKKITLDIQKLDSVNTPGISLFIKFIRDAVEGNSQQVIVRGNRHTNWHTKTFNRLSKVIPNLSLELF